MTDKVKQIQLDWMRKLNISRPAIARELRCGEAVIYNYFKPRKKTDGLTTRALHESINQIITKHERLQSRKQTNG